MKSKNREYRDMVLEIKAVEEAEEQNEQIEEREPEQIVVGYATTFDEPYTLMEGEDFVIKEVVDRGAFNDTDMSDVIMQYDHEGRVFARIKNKTLTVTPDGHGLHIEANLGGTELGRQLYEEIRGGYTDKMSFGFTVKDDVWTKETDELGREVNERRILSVGKLYDVSAVSIPANNMTDLSVRNLADGVIEQMRAERLKAAELELARRRAEIRAKALGGRND